MRILIASASRLVVGGAETYLRDLLPALARRGHEPGLLSEHAGPPGQPGLDAALPGMPAWCRGEVGTEAALSGVQAFRPEVVYSNGLESPDLEEWLAERYPVVRYAHNYRGTCVTETKCHVRPSAAPCARRMGPACLLLNYVRGCGARSPVTLLGLYRVQARRNALLRRSAAVLVGSRHMREELLRAGVAAERPLVLPCPPSGIRADAEPPGARSPTGRLLFLGRLVRPKGVDLLLRAVPLAGRELPGLRLSVVGDGPERPRLERLARRLGVEALFAGWADGADRLEHLPRADLLVVPSLWPEPFGMVGLEAGCVGLPAAGFAVGGIPDWLSPGVSGELAPEPASARGFADALVRALRDPAHHHRLRQGAWETARSFTLERHVGHLERVLARVAGGSG